MQGYTPADDGMSCVNQASENIPEPAEQPAEQNATNSQDKETESSSPEYCVKEIEKITKAGNANLLAAYYPNCHVALKLNDNTWYVLNSAEATALGHSAVWGRFYTTCKEEYLYKTANISNNNIKDNACYTLQKLKAKQDETNKCPNGRRQFTASNNMRYCAPKPVDATNDDFVKMEVYSVDTGDCVEKFSNGTQKSCASDSSHEGYSELTFKQGKVSIMSYCENETCICIGDKEKNKLDHTFKLGAYQSREQCGEKCSMACAEKVAKDSQIRQKYFIFR